jgi:hypothetical protein
VTASSGRQPTELEQTRRNWRWAAVAIAIGAFVVGRQSAPDQGPVKAQLQEAEELQRFTDREFYELWNEYADFADAVGRSSYADEVRARFEPQAEDFTEYP